jgi:IS5 family transposase
MKSPLPANQPKLYSGEFLEQLNPRHELLLLLRFINWEALDSRYGASFTIRHGRPSLPTRVVIGLLLLKYMFDQSDESVCERFVENPYWQVFCGFQTFQHKPPCDPTSLVRWRQRMGDDLEGLLKETLEAALRAKALKPKAMLEVIVDTTVMEKAVAHPSDARLLYMMQRRLVREAKHRGIALPRTWLRPAKRALERHGTLRRSTRKDRRKAARKELRRLRTFCGRLMRAVERGAMAVNPAQGDLPMGAALQQAGARDEALLRELALARRVIEQSRGKIPSSEKVYALHALEVECIGKGKPRKPWEFGVKTSLAVTAKKRPFITACDTAPGNPYDGATLKTAARQHRRMTGVMPVWMAADLSYRGREYHPDGVGVILSRTRKLGGALKRFMRRRSAIEPVIGHCKQSHRMERNYLLGERGDHSNAILSACAWNLMQVWRHLARKGRLFLRLLRLLAAWWRLQAMAQTRQGLQGGYFRHSLRFSSSKVV